MPDDDWDALEERIHEVEHRLLPAAVRALGEGRVVVEGRTVSRPAGGAAMTDVRPVRRALVAVFDKDGVVELGAPALGARRGARFLRRDRGDASRPPGSR